MDLGRRWETGRAGEEVRRRWEKRQVVPVHVDPGISAGGRQARVECLNDDGSWLSPSLSLRQKAERASERGRAALIGRGRL